MRSVTTTLRLAALPQPQVGAARWSLYQKFFKYKPAPASHRKFSTFSVGLALRAKKRKKPPRKILWLQDTCRRNLKLTVMQVEHEIAGHSDLVPKRGALRTLSLEVERELTLEDILALQTLPSTGPPPLKSLSARHKRQAQLLARGLSPAVVADALGTTPARVYQLLKDPAFNELVAIYQDQIHEESLDDERRFQEKFRAAGETSVDLINDRLEGIQDEVRISTSELRQIATMAADRTVAPPKTVDVRAQVPQKITLNFGTTLNPPKPKVINQEGEEE